MFIWNTANGHIVSSLAITPQFFTEAPKCLTWGGFCKDYTGNSTTSEYQFAIGGIKKITLWQLNPFTGQTKCDVVNTGTVNREYSCLSYSKNNEDFLFAGTASGDLLGFQIKYKSLAFNANVCARGIKVIRAVSADRVVIGGGDG